MPPGTWIPHAAGWGHTGGACELQVGVARRHYLVGAESSNLSKNSNELEPDYYHVVKATVPGILPVEALLMLGGKLA